MSARGPCFAPAALALAFLCALHLLCLLRAPAAYQPSHIAIALAPGAALTLGRRELAARDADAAHITLRRDRAGRWWIRNVSANRELVLQRGSVVREVSSTALHGGQDLQLGAASLRIRRADRRALAFTDGNHEWRYDGATLLRDGQLQPPCPDMRLGARVALAADRWLPRALAPRQPLKLGGNLNCANRVGIAGIAPTSAAIAYDSGTLLLSSPGLTPLLLDGAEVARREKSLDDVDAIYVGHTRLRIENRGAILRLRPARHVALYGEPQAQLPAQVQWSWQRRELWALPDYADWLVASAITAAFCAAIGTAWGGRSGLQWDRALRAAAGAALIVAGAWALALLRADTLSPVGWSMLLGWAALWCALLAPARVNLALAAGLTLLAIGLLVQLELGLAAPDSSWLRYYQKSAALLAVGLGAITWLRTRTSTVPMPQARAERLLLLLAGAALAALALQVLYGDETGVFDLQPVEFAKLALTALSAHCIALGLDGDAARSHGLLRWLRLLTPALLFLALLGVALVQVDDYSPLVLLLLWSSAMALSWALAARRYALVAVLACAAGAGATAIWGLQTAAASEFAAMNFYGERFMVWLDPASHPHTGQQLLLGARAIAEGGWFGADHALGLARLGGPAADALRIPAVQDDFAPAFFLNRHGLAGALLLWTLQVLFLAGLAQAALCAWATHRAARDFRHAWLARMRCFALCGGGAFVFGHFLLSWGTNLAIFPVMGQPMSFLSAGGSHLMFFICPLLAVGAVSVQSFEENDHAGLRPT